MEESKLVNSQITPELLQKIKDNPYSLSEHWEIRTERVVKIQEPEGYIGLSRLIYSGNNPFSRRSVKGLSLHDADGALHEFVYLSYFEKVKRKQMPARWCIRNPVLNHDGQHTYQKEEIERILEKMKIMHDTPLSGNFEQMINLEMGSQGWRLEEILRESLNRGMCEIKIRK
ncbi:MAG: hypothetical protein KKC19_03815 [Nanoarchaeota archaeon]|nr:hypothetical protein [Nanoarchaeota archaeon]